MAKKNKKKRNDKWKNDISKVISEHTNDKQSSEQEIQDKKIDLNKIEQEENIITDSDKDKSINPENTITDDNDKKTITDSDKDKSLNPENTITDDDDKKTITDSDKDKNLNTKKTITDDDDKKTITDSDKDNKFEKAKDNHTIDMDKHQETSSDDVDDSSETTESEAEEPLTFGQAVKKGFMEIFDTFNAFIRSPREIIGINLINIFEGMVYFGILTYLVEYFYANVGLTEPEAGFVFTFFTASITLSQFFFGGFSDKLGAIRSLGIALLILTVTRIVFGFSEFALGGTGGGLWSTLFFATAIPLIFCGLSYGLYQPSIYSLTRHFSDKKTSSISFSMLYAGQNLGAFLIGLALPHIRSYSASTMDNNGYSGSIMFLASLMIIPVIFYLIFLRNKNVKITNEEEETETEAKEEVEEKKKGSFKEYLKNHPLADKKFSFFIFILIPVQTLFVYQNALIPTYLRRCFTDFPYMSDNFETFANLNPLIVFFAAPIIASMTAKSNVYKMMIIGTTVMAAPAFLLVFGQTPTTFIIFVLLMSIGESIWQPRFLQHAAEIAPKDRVGAYMGIAQLPWFLTKFICGSYVGFAMQGFIPENGDKYPELMWLLFASVAMISPVALFLARKWCNAPKKQDDIASEVVKEAE